MAYLYTCSACERGEHGKCELSTPPSPPGSFGGSICRCGCRGDADWGNWAKMQPKIHKELMEQLRKIQFSEKQSSTEEVLKKTIVGGEPKKNSKRKKK
jgi:predicted Fe-S protein YdhL (DUF1289 family)